MVVKHTLLLGLVLGHLAVDLNQGALPALLPFLKDSMELSYAQSAAILMTMTFSSSIIQPLFGYFSDRFPASQWILPAGVLLGGLGFACLAMANSYWQIMLIVFISGLGIAAYHPQGAKGALISSPKKVVAMSWFMLGGNTGYGLGPVTVMACFSLWGQQGMLLFALPALVVGFLLWRLVAGDGVNQAMSAASQIAPQPIGRRWRPLALLLSSVVFRSSVQTGFLVFMPFYLISHMGWNKLDVAPLLTFYLIAGSAGTIIGGQIGQKIGPKRFFLISLLIVSPLNLLFLQVQNSLWICLYLGLSSACLMATWSSMVVMAQDIMPDRTGMAASLMVGFSIGGGGLCATLLGLIADNLSILTVMWLLVFLPLLSALLGCFVSSPTEDTAKPNL